MKKLRGGAHTRVVKLRIRAGTIQMHDGRRLMILGAEDSEYFAGVALRQATRLRAEAATAGQSK